ncbi:YhdP family protein [Thioalkalivibrio sp. XN8]|uniref:YhdP family protein n=1 Tax=Thioalkalivibrio sp. XN8 TaxID=2712863 RepID=UPI0013EC8645|nr:YhdP family protein [Thioalkalivibrio sp. XN8]NGP53316.1 TIGR02099 family protein [Thioalkalivibrio sp. XN8]
MTGLVRKAWRILAGTVAGLLVLAALLLGLVRLALVQVPEYRTQVETRAGELLGRPLRIAAMDARLGFSGLEFRADGISVLASDGNRTLFVARSGAIRLDTWALLRGQARLELVRLVGISVGLERDAGGAWRVLSQDETLELASAGHPAGDGLRTLGSMPRGRLELADVEVSFEDRLAGTGPWLFSVGELGLDLAPEGAELELAGRLPAALGGAVSASLAVTAQDERGWPTSWQLGAATGRLDLAVLAAALDEPPWWPAAGEVEGSVSVAAEAGELTKVAGDLRARELQLPAAAALVELEAAAEVVAPSYRRLGAGFEWTRAPTGWALGLTELEVARDGRRWESPAAGLAVRQEGALRRVLLEADVLQLEDLLPGLRWVPAETAATVLALAPAGRLRDLDLRLAWPEEGGMPRQFSVASAFEGLAVQPFGPWPGAQNLSGYLAGNQDTGSGQLDSSQASLAFPRHFRAPIALDTATGRLEWRRDEAALLLSVGDLQAGNADADISGRAQLRLPADDASPWLEIEATARDVTAAAAPKYLPIGRLPEQVMAWLDRAMRAGRVPEARFQFEGETRAFPFRADEGLFRVEFDWEEGELDYSPGWPAATGLSAAVRFENEGLFAEVRQADLAGVAAGPVTVAIPDLAKGELSVQGQAAGELADLRQFVLAADLLRKILGPGLEPASITAGRGEADVNLSLPLRTLRATRARVDLAVTGGELSYPFLGAPIRQVDARVRIDNARVEAEQASAELAGAPIELRVVTADDGAVRLSADGRLDADQLGQVLRLPVADWAGGSSAFEGQILFPAPAADAPVRMSVASGLEGLAIDLPAPAGKPADQLLRLAVSAEFPAPDQLDVRLDWADSLRLEGRFDQSGGTLRPGVVPGGVEGDRSGLVLSGAVTALDLGGWLRLPWDGDAGTGAFADWVAGGRLLIGRLATPLSRYDDVLVELAGEEAHWRFQLSGERVAGAVRVPFALFGEQPVEARLERLWVEPSPADTGPQEAAGEAAQGMHPAAVPALDLQVDDLRYANLRFGSVSALTIHEGDGFELVGLEGEGDGFMFQANGRSRLSDEVDASRLSLELDSDDVGRALEFMGFRRSMDAERGTFTASVGWQGGLRRDWLAAIEGEASLRIRDGTLLGVEPGAGRVFGLLSIQALPRRLALDFEDVFGTGTAFDRISGDFQIKDGNAYTQNLVMRGPAAEMAVIGRAGLVARDYDQTAVIGADLGVTLPVAGTVVGGPVVGAALFLLSEMLQRPFQTQLTYRITGPWDNPVLERLGPQDAAPPAEQQQEPPREQPQ